MNSSERSGAIASLIRKIASNSRITRVLQSSGEEFAIAKFLFKRVSRLDEEAQRTSLCPVFSN
jgi:hypothetical protein